MSGVRTGRGRKIILYLAIGLLGVIFILVVLALLGPALSQIPQEPCLTIGCESRLKVVLEGQVPPEYTLTVASGDSSVSVHCVEGTLQPGSVERVNAGFGIMYQDEDETTCTPEGAYIEGFAPLKFSVVVSWEDGTRSKRFRPRFDFCRGTCCLCKTIYMRLP